MNIINALLEDWKKKDEKRLERWRAVKMAVARRDGGFMRLVWL